MQAKTIKGNSTEEIRVALLQNMDSDPANDLAGLSFQPSLVLVFISVTN